MQEHIIYKGVKEFSEEQIRTIALRYANTAYRHTAKTIATEFSRDYEYAISTTTILRLIKKAIKNALVSEEIAIKIRDKAVYNSSIKDRKRGIETKEAYNALIQKRREFLENGGKHIRMKKAKNQTSKFDEQAAKEELKNLENRLKTIKHHIDVFDESNEEGVSLDYLLSQKDNLEKEIKKIKFYCGV